MYRVLSKDSMVVMFLQTCLKSALKRRGEHDVPYCKASYAEGDYARDNSEQHPLHR
jgi:hypothetical protein